MRNARRIARTQAHLNGRLPSRAHPLLNVDAFDEGGTAVPMTTFKLYVLALGSSLDPHLRLRSYERWTHWQGYRTRSDGLSTCDTDGASRDIYVARRGVEQTAVPLYAECTSHQRQLL